MMHLDLKVTSDVVCMRGHGSDRPKLGGAVAISVHCAAEETLALSGNRNKWKPLGRGSTLYNWAQHRNRQLHLEVFPA
jgi:hypothetical protein